MPQPVVLSQPAATVGRPDARPMRPVVSYARRGRLGRADRSPLWRRCAPRWWRPGDEVGQPGFDLAAWFGRSAPLIVEIGSGAGEATVALAAQRPEYDVLAVEVWLPGVAGTMRRMESAGVGNIRLVSADAAWLIRSVIAPDSVCELWTFFPDPWPKRRHHKRRLVEPAFAQAASRRLRAGGVWRLATDCGDYADSITATLDAEPLLSGGRTPRWRERPPTRFERRALAEDRQVTDLAYRRHGPALTG